MGMIAQPGQNFNPSAGIGATPDDPSGSIGGESSFSDSTGTDLFSGFTGMDLILPPPPPPDPGKPAPSIPNVSSVGSVAPTGVVNWNAIPGGFQPLPAVTGGKKKLYQLSQFHGGINNKSSPRDISDIECQTATNVTLSNIGRIALLGNIENTNNSITMPTLNTTDRGAAGYGLLQFTAPVLAAGTGSETVITIASDGDKVDYDDGATTGQFLLFSGTDNDAVAHIFYASGNGLYVNNANFAHAAAGDARRARVYVYREDAGTSQTVSGWKDGKPLIDSPTYDSDADAAMADGTVKCTHDGGTADKTNAPGTMIVECDNTNGGTGTWGVGGATIYYFYISWLFDNGCETGLTSFADDGGDDATSAGISFEDKALELNVSLAHTPHAGTGIVSNNTELGGDKRIEGARIYYKESGGTERFLLAEVSLIDGVKGTLDSTYSPWTESSDVYSHTTITFENPPDVHTFLSKNGYYAYETYSPSPDINSSTTAGPTALDVRYQTAVVGSGGIVFIGNVKFEGKHMPDGMMYSVEHQPGVFPKFNYIDSASSDGSGIMALAAFQDKILQFKQNSLYVFNISNGASSAYVQSIFNNCGVYNPCQVFTTSFGVIFANKFGCFIYDGSKVISLTGGKFDQSDWGLLESVSIGDDTANVPCVGYDPRSQSIIVLKDIGDDASGSTTPDGAEAWVYNMITQSWTMGDDMVNANAENRFTNFIITSKGYLSILRSDEVAIRNYNHLLTDDDLTITYITKDIDFGLPSQTKKIFKVYVTYFSNDAQVPTMTYGINGDTSPDTGFNSGAFGSSADIQTTAWTVNDAALTGIYSLSLKIDGATDHSFEIQDISILYRVRPIK